MSILMRQLQALLRDGDLRAPATRQAEMYAATSAYLLLSGSKVRSLPINARDNYLKITCAKKAIRKVWPFFFQRPDLKPPAGMYKESPCRFGESKISPLKQENVNIAKTSTLCGIYSIQLLLCSIQLLISLLNFFIYL